MIKRLRQNLWAKAENEFSWSSLAKKTKLLLFYLLIFLLPTQFGKHLWFSFSSILGVRVDYLSPTIYTTDILIFFLFLVVLIHRRIAIHPFFSLSMLFLAISVFFSQSPFLGWYGLLKFTELGFFVWYVARQKVSKVVVGCLLALGVLGESILAFAQIAHQGSIGGLLYFLGERAFTGETPGIANASVQGELILRPYATFSHPNMFAGYLVVAMLLIIFFLGRQKQFIKYLAGVALIVGTSALALSLSRVSIASWVVCGIAATVMAYKDKIGKSFLWGVLVVLVSLLVTAIFFPAVLTRLGALSFGQSLSDRVLLAKNALTMFVQHPLFGVGLLNFIPTLPSVSNAVILQPVHNIYLLIAAETGSIGFLLSITFLFFVIKKSVLFWKSVGETQRSSAFFLFLAFFVILFSGFFDHYFLTLQQGQLLSALVLGFLLQETSSDTIEK